MAYAQDGTITEEELYLRARPHLGTSTYIFI